MNEDANYRKVTWRLMPYLFLCDILAHVDRVNVGFAKLQMQQDLGMSDAVYGAGAGIFFLGYFLFEVPGNLVLQKIGARFWIAPIMMRAIQARAPTRCMRMLLGTSNRK